MSATTETITEQAPPHPTLAEATGVWLKIGLLSFGGPAGQIALMHRILVEERRWISEARFLHALNYCMLLPGPEAAAVGHLHRLAAASHPAAAWSLAFSSSCRVLVVILALSAALCARHTTTLSIVQSGLLRHQGGGPGGGGGGGAAASARRALKGRAHQWRSRRPRSSPSSSWHCAFPADRDRCRG